jgi:hypothetical protein
MFFDQKALFKSVLDRSVFQPKHHPQSLTKPPKNTPQSIRVRGRIIQDYIMSGPSPQQCVGCGQEFPSRNAFFKHLRETDGACLSKEDYIDFCKNIRKNEKGNKVLLLFGYLPRAGIIRNGDDAAILLLQAIHLLQDRMDGIQEVITYDPSTFKYNRSYGNSQRGVDVVAQDKDTGAITEVLGTKLRPVRGGLTVEDWLDQVQKILIEETFHNLSPCPVRILGRQDVQNNTKFNAEIDVSQRRIEYFLPVEAISWNAPPGIKRKLESLSPFSDNGHHIDDTFNDTDEETRIYLFKLKKLMQTLTTHVMDLDMNDETAVLQKQSSLQKRKFLTNSGRKKKKKDEQKGQDTIKNDESSKGEEPATVKITERHRVLRRKRYHNFTETLMAHEFLAFRRIDRMHHRSTMIFPLIDPGNKPFIVLSLTGDLFLTGLLCRLVGIFLALANNLIDQDIVDCLFDEDYPHLVPTPPAPTCGMLAAEARYMTWEGKLQSILSARLSDRFPRGWNQQCTLDRYKAWQDIVHQDVVKQWLSKGRDEGDGRITLEKEWTENVLLPWVAQAKCRLEDYRLWREQKHEITAPSEVPADSFLGDQPTTRSSALGMESVDASVPEAFKEVLYYLRKLDESGQWPATTPKRQLVMVSTEEPNDAKQPKTTSLSLARLKARSNNAERSSAYAFVEGQGGASGSFSVGLMPGVGSKPPKANYLFPELVKAAFELERVLCPEREPSSTIAINRNAQFRPHTDSGAGAGQSTSLIVGLGTYEGGELMVEGEKRDIRYKAIEFNGWKQRHWTLPFVGERYSLVWFTPKGCEGMRGIDLDLSSELADAAIDAGTIQSQ